MTKRAKLTDWFVFLGWLALATSKLVWNESEVLNLSHFYIMDFVLQAADNNSKAVIMRSDGCHKLVFLMYEYKTTTFVQLNIVNLTLAWTWLLHHLPPHFRPQKAFTASPIMDKPLKNWIRFIQSFECTHSACAALALLGAATWMLMESSCLKTPVALPSLIIST